MVSEEDKQKIDKINALEATVKEQIDKNDEFEATVKELNAMIKARDISIQNILDYNVQLIDENYNICLENDKINVLEDTVKEQIDKNNALEATVKEQIDKNNVLEATVKEQIDKINALEATVKKLNAIIKEERDKSIQKNICLENEIKLIQIYSDKFEQKNQYLDKLINERDQEFKCICKENTKLQKEAEKNLNETNKLKSDIDSQNMQIIQIQKQCQQQIQKEQTRLEEMIKDIANLKECINKLEIENSNKNHFNNELRTEKKNLLKKITELEANIIILSKENDELKSKLNKIDYGEGTLARLFNRLAKDKFVYRMHYDINMTRINVEICE